MALSLAASLCPTLPPSSQPPNIVSVSFRHHVGGGRRIVTGSVCARGLHGVGSRGAIAPTPSTAIVVRRSRSHRLRLKPLYSSPWSRPLKIAASKIRVRLSLLPVYTWPHCSLSSASNRWQSRPPPPLWHFTLNWNETERLINANDTCPIVRPRRQTFIMISVLYR